MTLDSETRYAVSDSADTADGGTVTITLDGKTVTVPLNPRRRCWKARDAVDWSRPTAVKPATAAPASRR